MNKAYGTGLAQVLYACLNHHTVGKATMKLEEMKKADLLTFMLGCLYILSSNTVHKNVRNVAGHQLKNEFIGRSDEMKRKRQEFWKKTNPQFKEKFRNGILLNLITEPNPTRNITAQIAANITTIDLQDKQNGMFTKLLTLIRNAKSVVVRIKTLIPPFTKKNIHTACTMCYVDYWIHA